jgi:hypothetical protein
MSSDSGTSHAMVQPLPTLGELELSEERRIHLAPKLDALLTQLRRLEELERPELEPAPSMARRWDVDDAR